MLSRFLTHKRAYGLEIDGNTEETQTNLHDTNDPHKQDQTPHNVVNQSFDHEAVRDFPELAPKPNRIPARPARS
jgi:hypothetical protein